MTDLVVGIRLIADGSGLVGQVRLSRAELDQLKTAEKGAAEAAKELAAATEKAGAASGRSTEEKKRAAAAAREAAKAARDDARALEAFKQLLDPATAKQAALNRQLEQAERLYRSGELSAAELAAVQLRLSQSANGLTRNLGLQRAGWIGVGQQSQDVFASYASGTALTTIFAQQSGQFATALSLIGQSAEGTKGKMGAFLNFLGGPGGIALGVFVSILGVVAQKLFETADAAKAAEIGSSGLADAQSVLGGIFDLTSGKIKTQNDLLIANARLTAINLRSEARKESKSAEETFGDVGRAGIFSFGPARITGPGQRRLLDDFKSGRIDAAQALRQSESLDTSGLAVDGEQFRQAIIDSLSSKAKEDVARQIDQSLDSGKLSPGLRRDSNKRDNSAKEAERLAMFGERAAESIARVNDEFNKAPRDIDRARQATAGLDALIAELGKRKPPGFEAMIADAKALKPIIQESLGRPIHDMLADQEREIDLGKLRRSGREAEAKDLQLTWQLMDKLGVESEDQLATELAKRGVRGDEVRQLYQNLAVMREQSRELLAQKALQQAWLNATGDIRENVRQTLTDLRSEGPSAVSDFFKRSLATADKLFADVLTEKLFGGLFRDLEDQITGADKVGQAGERIAQAVDKASGEILSLGDAAAHAAAKLKGQPLPTTPGAAPGADPAADSQSITIAVFKQTFRTGYEGLFNDLNHGLESLFTSVFGDRGLFSEALGKTLGRAFGGAQLGGAAGSLILGSKGSQFGSLAGGALGEVAGEKFLSKGLESVFKGLGDFAGPIGSIAGGLLGGLVGGLFRTAPEASAVITSADGKAQVSGNDAGQQQAVAGVANTVQGALRGIAQQLGGELGSFAVSIGKREDYFRVKSDGSASVGDKHPGDANLIYNGTDEQEALRIALQDAISDGAVKGISAQMQQALRSSPDVDKAVEEALKVQKVEELLGGLGYAMEKQFKDFEDQARERVRIAGQYGFDLIEIEKRNAEDRAKLFADVLAQRVGPLQSLLDDLNSGSLFEGSAADRRQLLLTQLGQAKTDALAGKDGAAEQLANVSRQLVELTRDAFGTAGDEFAADRKLTIDSAEAVIRSENDRIKAAQDAVTATNDKLDQANAIANESADYLAAINAGIAQLVGMSGGRAGGYDLSALQRVQQL